MSFGGRKRKGMVSDENKEIYGPYYVWPSTFLQGRWLIHYMRQKETTGEFQARVMGSTLFLKNPMSYSTETDAQRPFRIFFFQFWHEVFVSWTWVTVVVRRDPILNTF